MPEGAFCQIRAQFKEIVNNSHFDHVINYLQLLYLKYIRITITCNYFRKCN